MPNNLLHTRLNNINENVKTFNMYELIILIHFIYFDIEYMNDIEILIIS